jgi:hypothetical protein
MKKKTNRKLFDRSCDWIRRNWNATNLDVPDEFIERWIYRPEDEDIEPSGFYLAVFSFGYIQYDLVANNVPSGVKRSFAAREVLGLFQAWQMKLALVEIHRKTDIRIQPMPLFAFPAGEQIHARQVANAESNQ